MNSAKSKFNTMVAGDDVVEYPLPFGWKKVCKPRKNSEKKHWDVYIFHPNGQRFRSTIEVDRYLFQNPHEECDRSVTNTSMPEELKEKRPINTVQEFSFFWPKSQSIKGEVKAQKTRI